MILGIKKWVLVILAGYINDNSKTAKKRKSGSLKQYNNTQF